MGLQEDAKKKNVRVSRMFPGSKLALMCLSTGKTLAVYDSVEGAREAIKNRAEYVAPKDVVPIPVGWSQTFEQKQEAPRPCSNGYGFDCFCRDPMEDLTIFCPVVGCQRRAACLGVCDEHYQYARLMGHNVQDKAVEATQQMLEEYLILEGETAETAISTYDRAVANLKAGGKQTFINLKYGAMSATGGSVNSLSNSDLSAVADILGVSIRLIGSGDEAVFAAFDKDGQILVQHRDKAEVLKAFLWDEEELEESYSRDDDEEREDGSAERQFKSVDELIDPILADPERRANVERQFNELILDDTVDLKRQLGDRVVEMTLGPDINLDSEEVYLPDGTRLTEKLAEEMGQEMAATVDRRRGRPSVSNAELILDDEIARRFEAGEIPKGNKPMPVQRYRLDGSEVGDEGLKSKR